MSYPFELLFLLLNGATNADVQALISNLAALSLDEVDNALVGITQAHHEIHEGCSYYAYNTAMLDDEGTIALMLTTPDTAIRIHITLGFSSALGATMLWSKGSTHTDGGAFTPINRDDNSSNTSTVVVASNPTDGSDGSARRALFLGEKRGGLSSRGVEEIVLEQDEKYTLRITSRVNANAVGLLVNWYEI